jgi:beta-lactamase superfamily II metal-dependent hydrolase
MKQLTYSLGSGSRKMLIVAVVFWWFPSLAGSQGFQGFDSSTVTPVSDAAGQWGLKIVVLDVGQADAILVMTPNGISIRIILAG